MIATVTTTTQIELSIEQAAQWFANLDDDSQAKFFVEVAKTATTWEQSQTDQWWRVGSHLKNCQCSSQDARDMITTMASGIEHGTH